MGKDGGALRARWPAVAAVCLVTAASLAVAGCASSHHPAKALACPPGSPAGGGAGAAGASAAPAPAAKAKPAVAAGWALPGGNQQNTRDVASPINSSDVSKLGVAWTVPLRIPITHTDGAYATTPVVVNGVIYVQDLESNVMAISLATGKVLWRHAYNSPNGGPDGVNVAGGVVYAATNHAAFAPVPMCGTVTGCSISKSGVIESVFKATGEMVAVNQDTGQAEWDTRLPSSPYGAATVTNDVVFTTTFHGDLYALDAATGAILRTIPLSAGANAPVAIDGDYVIAGAGVPLSKTQRPMIIAYKLGATGKLPETVGS